MKKIDREKDRLKKKHKQRKKVIKNLRKLIKKDKENTIQITRARREICSFLIKK